MPRERLYPCLDPIFPLRSKPPNSTADADAGFIHGRLSSAVVNEVNLYDKFVVEDLKGMLQVASGYLPHCETESGLMMVVPLGLVVKHPTHVHHDVTLTEDLQVPGPHNLGIAIFWQHLQEDASEDFVTVKGAIMCPNPGLSLELVTHLLDEIGMWRCLQSR